MNGVKLIDILARAIYPIVTAYEFEFLKEEDAVQDWLSPCTIYFILQRPLTYITNVTEKNGLLHFEITDDGDKNLRVTFDPATSGYVDHDEEIDIEYQFYDKDAAKCYPLKDVAGLKLLRKNGDFIVWLSAQKIIYLYLSGRLSAEIEGDIGAFIDYKVHYIGQAFSQEVWERLTGHEKLQSILTKEDSFGARYKKNSYEISLLMLSITGFRDAFLFPFYDTSHWEGEEPILHKIKSDKQFSKFFSPFLAADAQELTNEVEAMLVNSFRPSYNSIKFNNYPKIKNGTRSAGYSKAHLVVEQIPAILYTDSYRQDVVPPIS